MNQVYCLTHMIEDDIEGELPEERYVAAANKASAIQQGKEVFGTHACFGCHEILESEWNDQLAVHCIKDVLNDEGDDPLLLFVLKKFPHLIDAELTGEILNNDLPKSFAFALTSIALEACHSDWLELVVDYQDERTLSLLLNKGMRDDGICLAQACGYESRKMFNMLYPVSNPRNALNHTEYENLGWIEERLAAEQKQRIAQHVEQPSRSVQRKM